MNEEQLQNQRHTFAHLLAASVRVLYPGAKNAIGPAVDDGFYQDFDTGQHHITEADLPKIEAKMRELLKTWGAFERREVSLEDAKKEFAWNEYKRELAEEFATGGKQLTFYTVGGFVDLCKGGHVPDAKEIDPESFLLDRVAGAYWRGDSSKKMLTRIYGLAFGTKEGLAAYVAQREEAKKRDHKVLGPQLDLFCFSPLVGPGLPLWTPRGTLVRNLLDSFVWDLRRARGYDQVDIPHITKKELYETSGHWDKFKDELFRMKTRDGHEFAMKPMNCPHHTQIYARRQWSYRDLPQRYASTTKVYRDEQTGELMGLSRVRSITQDDAHVFCRMDQVPAEVQAVWDIVHQFYGAFGFPLRVRLSLRDPAEPGKYLGDPERWNEAEAILRKVAAQNNTETFDGLGEAAFYAPKLDFMATDSLGRQLQVATIQLDMNMPGRFGLEYTGESGKPEQPVMIHAAIMGSIERFLAALIEHTAGNFPLWLSPVQAAILPIGEAHTHYAAHVQNELLRHVPSLRVAIDSSGESIGKKIRSWTVQKVPYLLVVGDKEKDASAVAVRTRSGEDLGSVQISELAARMTGELAEKK